MIPGVEMITEGGTLATIRFSKNVAAELWADGLGACLCRRRSPRTVNSDGQPQLTWQSSWPVVANASSLTLQPSLT